MAIPPAVIQDAMQEDKLKQQPEIIKNPQNLLTAKKSAIVQTFVGLTNRRLQRMMQAMQFYRKEHVFTL